MSDGDDPLEAELASMRPREPSAELRRRIADKLAAPVPAKRRWFWSAVLASLLTAAATVVVAIILIRGERQTKPPPDVPLPPPAPSQEIDHSLPTLQAYRNALNRSPEELEALLGKHASQATGSDLKHTPVFAFGRSDARFSDWTGEP